MSQADVIIPPAAPAGARPKVSYEEFLATDWGTAQVEWLDGEVVMMSPITGEHDEVAAFVSTIVRWYVKRRDLGTVRADPFQMKTAPDLPGRAPDLLFVEKANRARLHKTFLEGPADLAVEVISPGSIGMDRGQKFAEYEQGGVSEYWLIDPDRQNAQFYARSADGLFRPIATDGAGVFRSGVLAGFWLRVEWLWARPDVTDVFLEWGMLRVS